MEHSTHRVPSRESLLAANRDGANGYGSISPSHSISSGVPPPDQDSEVELRHIVPNPVPSPPAQAQPDPLPAPGGDRAPSTTPPASADNAGSNPSRLATQKPIFKEWRSWKIQIPWLSFILFVVAALIVTIGTLDYSSRRNSGFVRLGDAPSFITHIPGLGNLIWTQGVLYTAFPAFLMTVYRTMWEATIMAFAERQPYVELKRRGGGPPSCTIDLDYRSTPPFLGWFRAFRNRHLLLAVCMFCSALLALFVVPLTSFIFTPITFTLNGTTPLSTVTAFSNDIWQNLTRAGPLGPLPDVQLSMSAAGAVHLQDGRQPRWTVGQYAFGQFASLRPITEGTVVVETSAYSVSGNCEQIPDSDIQKQILTPGDTGLPASSITISAQDRGCKIMNAINFVLSEDTKFVQPYIRHWSTLNCPGPTDPTRFSILSAVYDRTSGAVTNFSLLSCAPSYRKTPGSLYADISGDTSLLPKAFVPSARNSSDFPTGGGRGYFEGALTDTGCFDKPAAVSSNSEFGQMIYQIASKKSAASPLAPNIMVDAAEDLFSTSFSIFASSILFPQAKSQESVSSLYSRRETRLIVVSTIAYIIIGILVVLAILTILLFVSRLQESMLVEEPAGLLGVAGLLFESSLLDLVEEINANPAFDGRTRKAAEALGRLAKTERYRAGEGNKISLVVPP
jgi:hypothetical protein